jgi:hypothetical protein
MPASQQQVQSGAMLLEHTARFGCSGVWKLQGSVCQHTQQEPVLPRQDCAAMHPCKHTRLLRADPCGQHERCAGGLQLLCAATGYSVLQCHKHWHVGGACCCAALACAVSAYKLLQRHWRLPRPYPCWLGLPGLQAVSRGVL